MFSERRGRAQNNHVPSVFWVYVAMFSQVAARQGTSASSYTFQFCPRKVWAKRLGTLLRVLPVVPQLGKSRWEELAGSNTAGKHTTHAATPPSRLVFGTDMDGITQPNQKCTYFDVLVQCKSKFPNNPLLLSFHSFCGVSWGTQPLFLWDKQHWNWCSPLASGHWGSGTPLQPARIKKNKNPNHIQFDVDSSASVVSLHKPTLTKLCNSFCRYSWSYRYGLLEIFRWAYSPYLFRCPFTENICQK